MVVGLMFRNSCESLREVFQLLHKQQHGCGASLGGIFDLVSPFGRSALTAQHTAIKSMNSAVIPRSSSSGKTPCAEHRGISSKGVG